MESRLTGISVRLLLRRPLSKGPGAADRCELTIQLPQHKTECLTIDAERNNVASDDEDDQLPPRHVGTKPFVAESASRERTQQRHEKHSFNCFRFLELAHVNSCDSVGW